jgi:hypothetical protein
VNICVADLIIYLLTPNMSQNPLQAQVKKPRKRHKKQKIDLMCFTPEPVVQAQAPLSKS